MAVPVDIYAVMGSLALKFRIGLLFMVARHCFAQQAPPAAPADPFAMDLDSLFNTKVTTASKFSEKLSDAAGVVSVVTQDELQRFGGTTLLEVLERVAGLNVSSSYFADSSLITIRGDQARANAGHILILINGRPVREILGGGISSDILESFPINMLERVEVVKGPGSVLYGSDAFSGVINLITKKADGKEFRATAAAGAAGEQSVTESVMYQQGALSIMEGGQYHTWPRWDITNRDLGLSGQPTVQNAVIRNDGTGSYLGINYKGWSFMSAYTEQEDPAFVHGVVGDTRLKRGFADLGYALKATDKWNMTFNGTYTRSVLDAPDFPNVHRDSYEADFEWTNFITLSNNDRLTVGAVLNRISGTETYFGVIPSLTVAKGRRAAGESYVQYEHKLTGDLKLIGGVQINKIGAIEVNAVPRGGVLWNPSNHWTMKVLYGGAYNAPSLDETLLDHPALHGNPKLVPEDVATLDAQVSYQTDRFQASLDYFHSRQSNLILQNTAVVPGVYYNDPRAIHFQGGEAEGKYYLKHDIFLLGSALYQFNDSGAGANNLSAGPSVVLKAGASYRSSIGTVFSVFDAYQDRVAGYQTPLNPPAVGFHSISAHARYDLSKRWWKESSRGFALFLNADDLLNKPIWLPAVGAGLVNTIPVVRGRTAFFGIEVWQK